MNIWLSLIHILKKPHGSAVLEMRRYASFIATSNQKDLLTDPSGSRRFICIEVTGVIDTNRPIDYEQLYAQAMYELEPVSYTHLEYLIARIDILKDITERLCKEKIVEYDTMTE